MKCAHCGTDSDFRARAATGACRVCGRRFVFEPRRDRNLTDLTFKLAIEGVSERGAYAWIDDQLYYDLCRRVRRRRLFHRLIRRPTPSLSRDEFELLFARWIDVHGVPEGRLRGRQFERAEGDVPPNADAYGFERLVVCESDAIVDVLLANGFHAEAKTPVLGFSGYPEHVHEALAPRLRENPPALVVTVHDASWEGCALSAALTQSPRWFAGVELPQLIDAGLRPADTRAYRGLYQRASSGRGSAEGVRPDEAEWLTRYRLDLAVARPRVLAGVLLRILRGETDRDGDGEAWPLVGGAWEDGDEEVG